MRVERLKLLAYGPFRGLELDLAAPGLHVVFGRNEAGKSTTLRAISGLLYGIDARTPDAHVFAPRDLRIGGELATRDGERARVVRRKGNANTLLDEAGGPLDDAVVRRLLRGISAETFRSAFALDLGTLESGAKALLEGRGDLGESLFDASVGGGGEVQRLLGQLVAEADAVYRPQGRALPLNEAIRAFTAAQKLVKERQSLPEAYAKQQRALDDAHAERGDKASRRVELVARRAELDRARRRAPLEGRREALRRERAEIGLLSEHLERVASLRERLTSYELACDSRRDLAREVERLADALEHATRRAGAPAVTEALRVDARKEARIRKLGVERSVLHKSVEDGRAALERGRRELARSSEAAGAHARTARRRAELEAKARGLEPFRGTLDALERLDVPSAEALDALATRVAKADRALEQREERVATLEGEALALERQIAEHAGAFAPPDPSELARARATRDEALARLRDAGPEARAELASALERSIGDADALADRMIREADRVTILARLRASAEVLKAQREEAARAREQAQRERASLDDEHRALWAESGLAPRGLAEMRAFVERRAQIFEAQQRLAEDEADAVEEAARAAAKVAAELDDRAAELARDEARLEETRAKLAELVVPLGLSPDASEEEVTSALDALRDVFSLADKRASAEAQAAAADADARAFEGEVARAVEDLSPELASLGPREATLTLAARAERARVVEGDLRALEEQLESVGREPVSGEIRDLAADPAASAAELERLDVEIADAERDLSRLDKEIGSLDAGLVQLRGDSYAAEAAAQAQEALARARAYVDRYMRAKLAAVILGREIERYRDEHQGPLLASTSSLFARLTCGAFSAVKAGFDDRDRPAIRCVRAGGEEVDVAGLSEGTRDQLYLALRLASLLRFADAAEPLPLVLDDVLVQFDDERTRAALSVLADVSDRMQVLFFTHHARVVELAREAVPAAELHVHELPGPAAPARDRELAATS